MSLYRVVETLLDGKGKRIPAGSIEQLKGISSKVIRVLLKKDRITKVQAPPLRILPGWEKRAEQLELLGIVDVAQFIVADSAKLARDMGLSVGQVKGAQKKALRWVRPPKGPDRKGRDGWILGAL